MSDEKSFGIWLHIISSQEYYVSTGVTSFREILFKMRRIDPAVVPDLRKFSTPDASPSRVFIASFEIVFYNGMVFEMICYLQFCTTEIYFSNKRTELFMPGALTENTASVGCDGNLH